MCSIIKKHNYDGLMDCAILYELGQRKTSTAISTFDHRYVQIDATSHVHY